MLVEQKIKEILINEFGNVLLLEKFTYFDFHLCNYLVVRGRGLVL